MAFVGEEEEFELFVVAEQFGTGSCPSAVGKRTGLDSSGWNF